MLLKGLELCLLKNVLYANYRTDFVGSWNNSVWSLLSRGPTMLLVGENFQSWPHVFKSIEGQM